MIVAIGAEYRTRMKDREDEGGGEKETKRRRSYPRCTCMMYVRGCHGVSPERERKRMQTCPGQCHGAPYSVEGGVDGVGGGGGKRRWIELFATGDDYTRVSRDVVKTKVISNHVRAGGKRRKRRRWSYVRSYPEPREYCFVVKLN